MSSALRASGSTWAWRLLRERVLRRDGHTCVYCGARATQVDHVISRALGGTDAMDNLVAAGASCNLRKGRGAPRITTGRRRHPALSA